MKLLIFFIACFCMLSLSSGSSFCHSEHNPPVRAICLGGWLVTEGYIKPSLFDGIPNKYLLDGTRFRLKSAKFGNYLSAENDGGAITLSNQSSMDAHWESFILWRINETSFNLRTYTKKLMGLNAENGVVAAASTPGRAETFEIHSGPKDSNRIRLKAPNGFFLQVKTEKLVTADYHGNGGWGDDDPSVFLATMYGYLQGEYQVTNGYGPHLAPKVMKKHWRTFIVEKDFKFVKENGINAVRVPVGWWIVHDPHPPKPYVGGSLKYLDKTFSWAEKYGLNVIIDLHGAPGSQNGLEHSGCRDEFQDWGQTDDTIQQTVDVIEFLTARYANSSRLFGIGLLNEPVSPGASFPSLIKYYKASYKVIRKYSQTAYVIMTNRFGPSLPREFFSLAKEMNRSVIDVHYYNTYSDMFKNLTVDQNIEYIYKERAQQLQELTNGPPIFVGEWTGELPNENVTKKDYQRFVKAQLEVFGNVTFGWAYWSLKNVRKHWSFEWNVKNGYLKI